MGVSTSEIKYRFNGVAHTTCFRLYVGNSVIECGAINTIFYALKGNRSEMNRVYLGSNFTEMVKSLGVR